MQMFSEMFSVLLKNFQAGIYSGANPGMFQGVIFGSDDDIIIMGDLIIVSEETKIDPWYKDEILKQIKTLYKKNPEFFQNAGKNKIVSLSEINF